MLAQYGTSKAEECLKCSITPQTTLDSYFGPFQWEMGRLRDDIPSGSPSKPVVEVNLYQFYILGQRQRQGRDLYQIERIAALLGKVPPKISVTVVREPSKSTRSK